ncbi:MAG: class I SAM-dependent DNA methyltransferase [Aquificaceae bacterium]|uniref:type I restriction-modification system subunit M n=1 Tax=Hydrogenobacter sp. Uz 6-8 TaxID=3384828 RepID=UPI0030B5BFBB
MDIKTLESWLWEAACSIRGPVDAPKYKEYILPLIFLKRLSDVFEDEFGEVLDIYKSKEEAERVLLEDIERNGRPTLVRFYIPPSARWENIRRQTRNLGEYLTTAVRDVAKYNPKLAGVIDATDFNATSMGVRLISDESLKALVEVLSKHRLGLKDVEPDILGRAYEYLLKKFAEGSGQSAGEFYTPYEVAYMMAKLIDPEEGQEVYDPCCGSGGLLIKCALVFKEKYGEDRSKRPLKFYGQEINHTTYAMAKMNVFLHDMHADIAIGDTMRKPAFLEADGSLKKFDLVLANPMWNQKFEEEVYENDPYRRFPFGYPPYASADWGWIQHMHASLKEGGKLAVVIDTGAVSRGSGSSDKNREKEIRKAFVERDLIEAVILLPENLFYNTTAPGVIIVINKAKGDERKGKVLLINISDLYEKGRPKNYLPQSAIDKVCEIYRAFKEEEGISRIVSIEEVRLNDYNLSPSRYVVKGNEEEVLDLQEAVVELEEAEEERREADRVLWEVLKSLV